MSVVEIKLRGSAVDTQPLIYCCKCKGMASAGGSIKVGNDKHWCRDHWRMRQRNLQTITGKFSTKEAHKAKGYGK